MKVKNILAGVVLAASLSIGVTANADVTRIKPDKNIGVYTSDQSVSFVLTRDVIEDETYTYTVENINGEIVRRGSFTASTQNSDCTVTPGIFIPGWYRLRVYDSTTTEIDIFASFTVVEPWVGEKNSPISATFTGYTGLTEEQIVDYSEAFSIIGLGSVRDAHGWYTGSSSSKATHDKFMIPLNNNGIKPLLTYNATNLETDAEKGITGNLYNTYSMISLFGRDYGDKIGAWEIINEPDLKSETKGFSADIFSSYYKAAALGIESSALEVPKSFGGLCQSDSDFFEIMMQNGVQGYTDSFNIHAHNTSNLNVPYRAFSSSLMQRAKVFSAIYGDNQPVWNSEAGLSAPIDDNNVTEAEHLKSQAKYAITSAVESIGKYGTENHFWFTIKHFLEGDMSYGSTSPEHCTYPVFYSLSMITRYLGEGRLLGEVAASNEDINGYFFDAGEYDVAVLWNSSDDVLYHQLKTTDALKTNNLISGTEYIYGTNNGLVNIPLTTEPVIVRFNGSTDAKNYRNKTFESTFVRDVVRTEGENVVMQAIWDEGIAVENGRYVLSPGETYNITLNVYNFNDTSVEGDINILVDDLIEIIGDDEQAFTVAAREYATVTTLTYTISLSEDAGHMEKGYISFGGTANNDNLIDVVCGYVIHKDFTKEDVGEITELCTKFENPWSNGNATTGIKRSIDKAFLKSQYTFTATFNGGNRYWYPVLSKTVSFESDGLVFDIEGISLGENTIMRVYVEVEGGSYLYEIGSLESGKKSYILPWEGFYAADGNAGGKLNPSDIASFRIGFKTSSDDEVKYTISGIGTYDIFEEAVSDEIDIEFLGIVDEGIYREGTNQKLSIVGEIDNIYHNYEDFDNYSVEDGKVVISIEDFEPGAHNIIVTKNDEFGRIHYKEIGFCIKSSSDYVAGGVFY